MIARPRTYYIAADNRLARRQSKHIAKGRRVGSSGSKVVMQVQSAATPSPFRGGKGVKILDKTILKEDPFLACVWSIEHVSEKSPTTRFLDRGPTVPIILINIFFKKIKKIDIYLFSLHILTPLKPGCL